MSTRKRKLTDIPAGHYHDVMERGNPVRRTWHLLKFVRVLEVLPPGPGLSLLDIGSFAGSLLSLASETRFSRQLGVDILPEQIAYANRRFGTAHRSFRHLRSLRELADLGERFDCVTCVEVIEHLSTDDIRSLFEGVAKVLVRGTGVFVLTTPNYSSLWPLLELGLNYMSDVDYSEQHITKFTWFDFRAKLARIVPRLTEDFEIDLMTTTHLLTPFVAGVVGVESALEIASAVPHGRWHVPFGNLILARFRPLG